MIWFKIKALEKLLIEGKMNDKLAFNYLLTQLIFLTLVGYLNDNDDPIWFLWVHLIISVVAVVWGVRKTFEINQEGGNRDYFKRFISLSFVAGIRMVVLALAVAFPLALAAQIAGSYGFSFFGSSLQSEIFDLVIYLCFDILYFYMLVTSFKRINAADVTGGQLI